jgi:hypothetical protein
MFDQVMLSFYLSASMTIVASLVAADFSGDMYVIICVKPNPQTKAFWIRVLDRFILSLSDQQLVTGVSILLIGFFKVPHISTYHFLLITNLGMFSCSAHLASVIILRRYFHEHPSVAKARIFLMLFFAFALIIAMIMAKDITLGTSGSLTLQCPLRCTIVIVPLEWAFFLTLVLLLLASYYSALAYVFPNGRIVFTTWLITKPAVLLERMMRSRSFHERVMHWRPFFPTLVIAFILQLCWWAISFALSLAIRLRVFSKRLVIGSENTWSFGQILAVLLIVLPFLNALEIYFGSYSSGSMPLTASKK